MADTLTLRSDITNSKTQTYYDSVLLRRAHPYEVHGNFGQTRPLPEGKGNEILFRRYENLGLATTPLTEAQTPSGQKMSKTDITATVKQYGDYIHISDVVDLTARDPVLTEAAELLGEQMGKTRDVLIRDKIVGGYTTNKSSAAYDYVSASSASVTATHFDNAVDNLLGANARYLTSAIRPSTGYNTVPIRPAYVAIVHPNLRQTIETFSGFVPVVKYPANENVLDGEWGAVGNVRVVLSTLADSGGDIEGSNYIIPVFAADAYGVTELAGGAASNIVKGHGSGGTTDPLDQRATSGWKMMMTAMVLNPKFMTIIYGCKK